MKKHVLVSVIILNYNKPDDTIISINSVLKQSYSSFEVIVVDDHSSNNSVTRIRKRFAGIKIISLPKSLGRAGWNEGMKIAKGDIFLLLDADMFLTPTFLEKLIQKFSLSSSIQVVTFYMKHPTITKSFWEPVYVKEKTKEGGHEAFSATIALRRNVFNTVGGYDPNFFLYVEYEYYIQLLKHGYKVIYFPDLVAYHNESPNPYRTVMRGYHVVKNQMQLYALYLPVKVWPLFLRHHNKEFSRVLITGEANRWGILKGLSYGLFFFLKALPRRSVLKGEALETFLRFYFPQKGDVVVKKYGWK